MSKPARRKKSKAERRGRRKPMLNEERVRVIASTFEYEVGCANFRIVSVGLDIGNPNEWIVIVQAVFPHSASVDGFDCCIMVNDKTGEARYRDG